MDCGVARFYILKTMLAVKIVKITSAEVLSTCAPILVEAYNAEPWNDQWTAEKALEKLECFYNSPKFIGLLAYVGDQIKGACVGNIEPYYTGDYFYLKEMFVAPSAQKMGIGQKLMDELKSQLEQSDIRQMILFTSKEHFPFKFYEKANFAAMDEMRMMHFSTDGDGSN